MGIKAFVFWRRSREPKPSGWNPCSCCGAVYSETPYIHNGIQIIEGDAVTQDHPSLKSERTVIQTRTGPITVETYHYG